MGSRAAAGNSSAKVGTRSLRHTFIYRLGERFHAKDSVLPAAAFDSLNWTPAVRDCSSFRPELRNPPVSAEIQAPAEVKRYLKTPAITAIPNETELEWFDRIVACLLDRSRDVRRARAH